MEEETKKGIGKLKMGLVVSVIVIVVLAGLNIWFFVNKQSLELQIDDLQDNYGSEQWWHIYYQNLSEQLSTERANLQNQVNTLTSQVATLQTQYDTLNTSCYEALVNFSSLQTQYDALNASYYEALADIVSLQTDLTNMTNWKNSLSAQIVDLEDQVDYLNTIMAQKDVIIADLEARIDELVYVLTDEEYYYSLKSDLENANETILVAMYSMKYDPGDLDDWANDLIEELVDAKDRGVNITVIIENRTYFDYMNENLEAYQYLSENNVTVQLDNENDTDHMKLVIIDDNIVYVGSHNWSESGLHYNHETSVKIVSEDIADIFIAYFETI